MPFLPTAPTSPAAVSPKKLIGLQPIPTNLIVANKTQNVITSFLWVIKMS